MFGGIYFSQVPFATTPSYIYPPITPGLPGPTGRPVIATTIPVVGSLAGSPTTIPATHSLPGTVTTI